MSQATADETSRSGRASFDVDVHALNRQRLERAQAALRASDLPAAVLFDPANVRYVTCHGQFLVANLHCS